MILKFATKRGPNGYRKYLALDTDRKQYATESTHWYTRDDMNRNDLREWLNHNAIIKEKNVTKTELRKAGGKI